ncbi:Phosphatidylserine decarboxylase [hydrothermal vent metagenome]|uniref:phosphatidylserine decarboxylase n=1 Tax=hydrothermal vent metagenome TaxID=652676 RepID=A0A3B0VQ63_9ZZZZ
MKNKFYTWVQYILPHRLLSRIINWLMRVRWKPLKNFIITRISKSYNVNMQEAASSDLNDYIHFNAFFTRKLKAGVRPIDLDKNSIISPVDGAISQCGKIQQGRIFQAKGFDFSVKELLACDNKTQEYYQNGQFATIYLSPKDYHRMHAPIDCEVTKTVHIPGRLFSVAKWTAQSIPRLFARNERLVCYLDTQFGQIAYVLVGAIMVSSMETVFNGLVTPPYARKVHEVELNANTKLAKGDEVGRFNMGSTVILLFPPDVIELNPNLSADKVIKLGEKIATILQ